MTGVGAMTIALGRFRAHFGLAGKPSGLVRDLYDARLSLLNPVILE